MLVSTSKAQPIPVLKIFQTSKNNCINSPLRFSSQINDANPSTPEAAAPVSYTWSVIPSKGLTLLSGLNGSSLSMSYSVATNFTVYLKISRGDFTALTYSVGSIGAYPKASFNATFSDVGYPNNLILTSYSTNSLVNHWIYSDTNKIDSTDNAVKNYSVSGSYSVMLVTVGSQGCRDTARYNFYLVDSSGITLPNIFTPNGDGINDVYKPIARGISKLSAKIYNRNAVLIHAWDSPQGYWDGHTNSGEPCTDGEYFIILNATGFDGKTYSLNRHITLIR